MWWQMRLYEYASYCKVWSVILEKRVACFVGPEVMRLVKYTYKTRSAWISSHRSSCSPLYHNTHSQTTTHKWFDQKSWRITQMDLKKKSTTLSLINPKYRKYRVQYITNGMVSKKQDWAYRERWTMGLLSLEFTGLRKLKFALETDIKINLDPAVWFIVSWYKYVLAPSPNYLINYLLYYYY